MKDLQGVLQSFNKTFQVSYTAFETIQDTREALLYHPVPADQHSSFMQRLVDPQGLRTYLNKMYERYQKPLFIVENGLGAKDVVTEDQQIHDEYCIDYMRKHIQAIGDAMEDGVEIIGYTPWGSIELVSCSGGEMSKRYGSIWMMKEMAQEAD